MNDIKKVGTYLSYTLYHADVISSTNTYLKENGKDYPDLSVLLADVQTEGRGRGSHIWKSDSDITFSILTREKLHYDFIAPLSVRRALSDYGIPALIKWPNDIYADMRKICGMLIECSYEGGNETCAVIGIGVNYTPKNEFHAAGCKEYTSAGKDEIMERILCYMAYYSEFPEEELLKEYKDYNLVLGMEIIHQGVEYKITGFDSKGALKAVDKSGSIHIIYSDEISIKESVKNYDRYFKG